MDTVRDLVILGIDSILLGICLKAYLNHCKALTATNSIPVLEFGTPMDEFSILSRELPFVAITGEVKAVATPLQSIQCPGLTGVIQKITTKEIIIKRTSFGIWKQTEQMIKEVYTSVPFVLLKNNKKVLVLNALKANILDLENIADTFEPNSLGMVEQLLYYYTPVRLCGILTTEHLLREGVSITVIGKLTSTGTGEVLLQPPTNGIPYFITTRSLPELMQYFEKSKNMYRRVAVILAGIGIIIATAVVQRWWYNKMCILRNKEYQRIIDRLRREYEESIEDEEQAQRRICVVCLANTREIITLPCGHICLCQECSDAITDFCPVCRSPIIMKANVHLF